MVGPAGCNTSVAPAVADRERPALDGGAAASAIGVSANGAGQAPAKARGARNLSGRRTLESECMLLLQLLSSRWLLLQWLLWPLVAQGEGDPLCTWATSLWPRANAALICH